MKTFFLVTMALLVLMGCSDDPDPQPMEVTILSYNNVYREWAETEVTFSALLDINGDGKPDTTMTILTQDRGIPETPARVYLVYQNHYWNMYPR